MKNQSEIYQQGLIEFMEAVERITHHLAQVGDPKLNIHIENLSLALRIAEGYSHQKFSNELCGKCGQRLDLHVVRLNAEGFASAFSYVNPNDNPADDTLVECTRPLLEKAVQPGLYQGGGPISRRPRGFA